MDLVDAVIIAALAYAAIRGYRVGLTYSLLSLAGLLLGLAAGALLVTSLPPDLGHLGSTVRSGLAIAILVGLALLGDALGTWLGARLRVGALRRRLGPIDSLAGVAWGLLVVLATSWYLGLTLASGPWPPLSSQIQRSAILRALSSDLPQDPAWVGALQHLLAAVPFPEVFANLVPPLPGQVPVPASLAGNAAVQAAARETVKVVSVGCGGLEEGSGFPVAPDLVMTNAHVVAGGRLASVEVPGRIGSEAAQVVLFDPERDLALLRVPGLGLSPLALAGTAARGTPGAVIGYPEGGPEAVVPGAIRGRLEAVGRDIYSRQLVSREIYVIQATVVPGNSGGPLVNLKGQVMGVVFARSLIVPGEGFALTSGEVERDVSSGASALRPVSTESCVN